MAHSQKYVRSMVEKRTERTPQDKGYRMTITIEDMDNGIVSVNGVIKPRGYTGAALTLVHLLDEFEKHVERQRRSSVA